MPSSDAQQCRGHHPGGEDQEDSKNSVGLPLRGAFVRIDIYIRHG